MATEKDQTNYIYEARTENMVSQKDGKLKLRTGKFLKPCAKSIEQALKVPNAPLLTDFISHNIQLWPPKRKVLFKDWKTPQKNWKQWVDKLSVKYRPIWEKAGIFDGIMCSIYEVRCNHDLVIGLSEFWCFETNTFLFPWGEASITLEDVMILGGLSVLGESVSIPLTGELKRIEEGLNKERLKLGRSKTKKASHGNWLNRFMEEKGGGELEHLAFLSLWLTRFVFPSLAEETMDTRVFPIAIRLSKGIQVALAPAVLASLYKNLELLNQQTISSLETVVVSGPFRLMQLWALEHFPILSGSSLPSPLQPGEPRVARWHKLSNRISIPIVRSVLKLAENFEWRPYAANLKNWQHLAYYKEAEQVVHNCSSLDEELKSFLRCLSGRELIGIDCKEKYMPQRVAMQFGFDQDLPGDNSGADFLCENLVVFVPPRSYELGVSAKYFDWWNSSRQYAINDVMVKANDSHTSVASKSMKMPMKKYQVSTESNCGEPDAAISPESPSNTRKPKVEDHSDDDEIIISERMKKHDSANRINPNKVDASENSARKRKWTATEVHRMAGDPEEVKKKNGKSTDDPIEIADAIEEIAEGKASRESNSGKIKQEDSKKVGDCSSRSIDLDKFVKSTSRNTAQQPKLDLEERLARLENFFGVIPPRGQNPWFCTCS